MKKVTKRQKAVANRDARDMKPSRNYSHMAGRLNPRVLAENYMKLSIDLRFFCVKNTKKAGKACFGVSVLINNEPFIIISKVWIS